MVIDRSKNIFQFLIRTLVIAILLFLCFELIWNDEVNYSVLSVVVLILSISEIVMLIFNDNVYGSGLTMIFFLYTLLVHNGFVIAYLFDKSYISYQSSLSMAFVSNPYYSKAIIIANIIIGAFVLSAEINKKEETHHVYIVKQQEISNEGDIAANTIGLIGLLVGGLYLAYIVYSDGLWLAGYSSTLSTLDNNSVYGFTVIITSLSIALLIGGGTKKAIYLGLVLYFIISLLHFSMGNRGEVMYAAVICFALYSIRFKTIKLRHVIIGVFVAIILIPLVRFARELKMNLYTLNPLRSFLDVLCEEGIEISPFTYTVQCVETKYGHAYGLTYLNDFLDFLCRRFGTNSPIAVKKNIIKEIMPYSGMAYSMVAELYYNFGVVVAAVIYSIFAQALKKLDADIYYGNISDKKKIFFSMVMVEMINLTRNDASTLPLYLAFIGIIYVVYSLLLHIMKIEKN